MNRHQKLIRAHRMMHRAIVTNASPRRINKWAIAWVRIVVRIEHNITHKRALALPIMKWI